MTPTLIVQFLAIAPIAHGAFGEADAGNASPFRRFSVISDRGEHRVPALSSGSLRGQIRRIVMRDLFERAGLSRLSMAPVEADEAQQALIKKPKAKAGDTPKAWDRLYAALANGGHLEKSEARIDPDAVRQLRADLPPLSVLGAALYSRFLPGRLHPLGQVWPASRETAFIHPLLVGPHHAESLISEVSLVRHVDREEQEPDVSGVTPMPTTTEVLSAGTRLVWFARFAGSATPIERAVVPWAINQITHLGGKHNAGMGAVDIVMDGPDADPAPYAEWLEQTSADDLRTRLLALSATL